MDGLCAVGPGGREPHAPHRTRDRDVWRSIVHRQESGTRSCAVGKQVSNTVDHRRETNVLVMLIGFANPLPKDKTTKLLHNIRVRGY